MTFLNSDWYIELTRIDCVDFLSISSSELQCLARKCRGAISKEQVRVGKLGCRGTQTKAGEIEGSNQLSIGLGGWPFGATNPASA